MSVDEVLRVVDQIIPLLTTYGHPDEAEWLRKESALLRDSKLSHTEIGASLGRLHRIVPGMGGLMDLPMIGSSREQETLAREALDKLGERLYELTR